MGNVLPQQKEGEEEEGRERGGGRRGLPPISSRGPCYSGLMGLQRSEKHRRVAAVVSVTLVIYWANFLPPPKKRELVWVEGRRSRRRRLTRKPRGSRKTPGRMCASCVHSVCIHKCVCAITLDPPAYVCVFYREVFIKGCLAAGM